MWKGIRPRFIASQVWYKYFQTAQGCQRLPVSYCPSLSVVLAPRFPTVSQSVLLPSLFQALGFIDEQALPQLRFSQCPALIPCPAIPSWNAIDIDFFSHAFVMAVFRHPLAFGVLLVCLLLQPHACNASSKQDVAKCFDQLLQADVAFWEDAKVWIWLFLTTALCLNVISLGTRLVWTRSTAHSIPGECRQANYEKERQNEEIWKICWQSRSQNR